MKRFLILCTTIFFSIANYGQDSDSVFKIAVKFFNNGDTLLAQKEIQRAILFDTLNNNYQKYYTAAHIFAATNNFDKADICFNVAFTICKDKLECSKILMSKADIYLLSKKYFNAISVLLQIDTTLNKDFSKLVLLRLGLCNYCLKNYDIAYQYFLKIVPENNVKQFNKLYKKCNRIDSPSPIIAAFASAFVPGLGQYLSLSFLDGISSQLLISSFAMLGVYLAQNYGNWTAILCVLPWLQRYYFGGIKNATLCAKKRHLAKANKLKQFLEPTYNIKALNLF